MKQSLFAAALLSAFLSLTLLLVALGYGVGEPETVGLLLLNACGSVVTLLAWLAGRIEVRE